MLTESVDGRFVPWESFLEWESYLDLYCLALRRLGVQCVKYVPSIGVRETLSYKHRFGHVVKRVPVTHRLLNPYWLSKPRPYTHGYSSTSHHFGSIGFSLNLIKEARRDGIDLLHYASYYSTYFAASPIPSMFWPILTQYTGGSLPPKPAARLLWRLLLIPLLRFSKSVLIGQYPAELLSLREDLYVPTNRIAEFNVPVVDRAVFHEIERQSAARSIGVESSTLNILAVTFIPERPHDFLAKNPFAMLDIFEFVKKKSAREVALHIVGFGPGVQELETLVREKGLDASVFLHGRTEHSKLPLYYSASDLVFVPYPLVRLNEGSVTAEAFSCARPVVAFKRKDSAQAEQPGGFLIDMDPKAGGAAIVERMQDERYLKQKGREGLKVAEQFSLERAGARLSGIYASVISSRVS